MSDEKKRKTIRFFFRIDEDSAEHLSDKADEMGLSMSEYLRRLAVSEPMVRLETKQNIERIKYELAMIGNNLNQIAKEPNSTHYIFFGNDNENPKKIKQTLENMDRVLEKIYETY